jgi:hypothetical protein
MRRGTNSTLAMALYTYSGLQIYPSARPAFHLRAVQIAGVRGNKNSYKRTARRSPPLSLCCVRFFCLSLLLCLCLSLLLCLCLPFPLSFALPLPLQLLTMRSSAAAFLFVRTGLRAGLWAGGGGSPLPPPPPFAAAAAEKEEEDKSPPAK